MKPDRAVIELPPDLVRDCDQWGHWIVAHYAGGGSSQSRAFSSHGAENNPVLQSNSKIAECIFALHMNMDPRQAVRSSLESWDIKVGQTLVDVKRTELDNKFLIWPINKNPIYATKHFHVLALVKTASQRDAGGAAINASGYVRGWIGKRSFAARRQIAGPAHKLTEGTWHMHEDLLHRVGIFPGLSDDWREHYCHCGEWGAFGFNVSLRKGQLGTWYCAEHNRRTVR